MKTCRGWLSGYRSFSFQESVYSEDFGLQNRKKILCHKIIQISIAKGLLFQVGIHGAIGPPAADHVVEEYKQGGETAP